MSPHFKILVTGAGGFIGKDVVSRLLIHGWHVKAMLRNVRNLPFEQHDNLEIVCADMCDMTSLNIALREADVVVHLAALKSDEKESEEVNVRGAERLVTACKKQGCERIINISTQSAKIRRKGIYAWTKSEADRVFHDSGLPVTTLMPSIIYGEELSGVFGSIVGFARKLPVIPVLGDGKWISAPIYIGDVSKAIISCIENDNTIGNVYDLGGPDLISFDNLINTICSELGNKRPKVHIPFKISLIAANIVTRILPHPPITVSNVLGSNQDTNISIDPARRDFGFDPISLAQGLKDILGKELSQPAPHIIENAKSSKITGVEVELTAESILIGKYLIGEDPPEELRDRYIKANLSLLQEQNDEKRHPELAFVRRHPALLPFIDAATGLMKPKSIVRKKIFLMTAVLETTPIYENFFIRECEPVPKLLLGLLWQGLRSVAKLILGIPLFLLARRG